MKIAIIPRTSSHSEGALVEALRTAGPTVTELLAPPASRWLQAALAEGVEREPERRVYALSPRSNRGASRA